MGLLFRCTLVVWCLAVMPLCQPHWMRGRTRSAFGTWPAHEQRGCSMGKRQDRKHGPQQHPPGPQSAATAVPTAQWSLLDGLFQASRHGYVPGQPLRPHPEHKGGLLLLNWAWVHLEGGARYQARLLPFNADVSHNPDPHGRGKEPGFYHLLNHRNR